MPIPPPPPSSSDNTTSAPTAIGSAPGPGAMTPMALFDQRLIAEVQRQPDLYAYALLADVQQRWADARRTAGLQNHSETSESGAGVDAAGTVPLQRPPPVLPKDAPGLQVFVGQVPPVVDISIVPAAVEYLIGVPQSVDRCDMMPGKNESLYGFLLLRSPEFMAAVLALNRHLYLTDRTLVYALPKARSHDKALQLLVRQVQRGIAGLDTVRSPSTTIVLDTARFSDRGGAAGGGGGGGGPPPPPYRGPHQHHHHHHHQGMAHNQRHQQQQQQHVVLQPHPHQAFQPQLLHHHHHHLLQFFPTPQHHQYHHHHHLGPGPAHHLLTAPMPPPPPGAVPLAPMPYYATAPWHHHHPQHHPQHTMAPQQQPPTGPAPVGWQGNTAPPHHQMVPGSHILQHPPDHHHQPPTTATMHPPAHGAWPYTALPHNSGQA